MYMYMNGTVSDEHNIKTVNILRENGQDQRSSVGRVAKWLGLQIQPSA